MRPTSTLCALITAMALLPITHAASAQTQAPGPSRVASPANEASSGAVKLTMEPSLIVMNAHGASLQGQTLTLVGVSPNSIVFADRPVRAAGHLLTADVLDEWTADGSFVKDAPNATVSVMSGDGRLAQDLVVELKSPKLEGDNLTFDVRVLEGSLANADGPASVFIDIIGLPWILCHLRVWLDAPRGGLIGTGLPSRRTILRMATLLLPTDIRRRRIGRTYPYPPPY